jgi:hypothetical protein
VEYYAERENHLREKIRLQKETALQTKLGENKKCSCGVADPNPVFCEFCLSGLKTFNFFF